MDRTDRRILERLQEGLPLVADPYRVLGRELGLPPVEILDRLQRLKRGGVIRRIKARIDHRRAGITANALVAWRVPDDQIEQAGEVMAGSGEVTHCYIRRTVPGRWEYNLYTVLHGYEEDTVRRAIHLLSRQTGLREYRVLFSTDEYKRSTIRLAGEEP